MWINKHLVTTNEGSSEKWEEVKATSHHFGNTNPHHTSTLKLCGTFYAKLKMQSPIHIQFTLILYWSKEILRWYIGYIKQMSVEFSFSYWFENFHFNTSKHQNKCKPILFKLNWDCVIHNWHTNGKYKNVNGWFHVKIDSYELP